MDSPERYGPYLVYERIGKGGMATVHRAERQTKRGMQEVALKRMFPSMQREMVALFLDEARLVKYLKHPNIAELYDSGRVFGTYFIAMEYVRGPTLKDLVDHCRVTVGSVPQAITLYLAGQLCDALEHAHTRCDEHGRPLGIIHRDVTPGNIMVSGDGNVKLIDFGLAKAKVMSEQTGAGIIKGKYAYVAPEYTHGTLDHRADLWAVGIIMYELLTSRALFHGHDAFETIRRVRELPIPRPSIGNPSVTPELDEIVMKALERDPARRWPTAAAMRDHINAVRALPGNAIEARGVANWLAWVFQQQKGRTPQLTPMMALPVVQPGLPRTPSSPSFDRFATTRPPDPFAPADPFAASDPFPGADPFAAAKRTQRSGRTTTTPPVPPRAPSARSGRATDPPQLTNQARTSRPTNPPPLPDFDEATQPSYPPSANASHAAGARPESDFEEATQLSAPPSMFDSAPPTSEHRTAKPTTPAPNPAPNPPPNPAPISYVGQTTKPTNPPTFHSPRPTQGASASRSDVRGAISTDPDSAPPMSTGPRAAMSPNASGAMSPGPPMTGPRAAMSPASSMPPDPRAAMSTGPLAAMPIDPRAAASPESRNAQPATQWTRSEIAWAAAAAGSILLFVIALVTKLI